MLLIGIIIFIIILVVIRELYKEFCKEICTECCCSQPSANVYPNNPVNLQQLFEMAPVATTINKEDKSVQTGDVRIVNNNFRKIEI